MVFLMVLYFLSKGSYIYFKIQCWRFKPTDFQYRVVSNNENNAKLKILIFSLRCNNYSRAILFPQTIVFVSNKSKTKTKPRNEMLSNLTLGITCEI